MTVKELIEELEKAPFDAKVIFHNVYGTNEDVNEVTIIDCNEIGLPMVELA